MKKDDKSPTHAPASEAFRWQPPFQADGTVNVHVLTDVGRLDLTLNLGSGEGSLIADTPQVMALGESLKGSVLAAIISVFLPGEAPHLSE